MTVKIRMTRKGNRHNPFYRVVVADERAPRDGKFLEIVGTYDPCTEPVQLKLEMERIEYWTKNSAKTTQTVSELVKRFAKGAAR